MELCLDFFILLFVGTASSVWIPSVLSFQPTPGSRRSIPSKFHKSSENDQNLNSVGDYVRQVHGGKYQFNDAGINSVGQEFAETGYASSSTTPKEEDDAEAKLLAEIPRWANRMGTEADIESRLKGNIDLESSEDAVVSIDIVNGELTWEPFYVKVMTTTTAVQEFGDTQPLLVHPQADTLAPRGGAVNLCDPQNPYSDRATIRVELSVGDLSFPSLSGPLYLLIGTEEEKWYYSIQLGS